MKRIPTWSIAGCVLSLGLVGGVEAQSPSPRPARRRPAPPAASRVPTPAPTPAPAKPRTAIEELVAIVSAEKPGAPADDAARKLMLARVAVEAGDAARARVLLDEVAPVIDQMPKIDPGDKEGKNLNFQRVGLRSQWMSVMVRLDPVSALRTATVHGSDTNLFHHASALTALLQGLDCTAPERKAVVEENVRLLLQPVEEALKARTWGLSSAPHALDAVARAARVCGLEPAGAAARDLAQRTLKVFEQTDLRIRACDMAVTKVRTAAPAERPKALGVLAQYQLKPQYKGDEPDRCLTEKLYLAGGMVSELGADDPARQALADLVAGTVAQLDEKALRFHYCGAAGVFAGLTGLNATATEKGIGVALTVWRKQDRVESYCDVPTAAALAGRRLAQSGTPPAWLCSVLSAQPEGKVLTDDDKLVLRKQRALAAVELRGRCPEADAALRFDRSDVALLKAVRARQVVLDRIAAEPLVLEDLRALTPVDRYAYATTVLPAFWEKE